ncbi:MAG: arginine--tRNA ligase [Pseudomonadales bacterium]
MSLKSFLSARASEAMAAAGIPDSCSPHLNPGNKPEFGDFQINGAMAAAKQLKANPREIAQQIIDNLQLDSVCSTIEIAGPGFINLKLDNQWLAGFLGELDASEKLGTGMAENPDTVVIDYSSPNVAKEMHVGHLRGTILGDSLVRVLQFLGHRVIRQNHIGDWGTQFGMLIAELEDQLASGVDVEMELGDLEVFYRQAKIHFDNDPGFADRARENVVKLQSGDERCLELWRKFIGISMQHAQENYDKLGVTLGPEDTQGESAYNDDLERVVSELKEKTLAVEDQGAQVVFIDELADKNGDPSVFIVQKAGGGYLYATTDLAAIRYRVKQLKANRILYFIDARQSLHMKQVFATARMAGWFLENTELLHCAYGTIMGEDGKPFKTRSGDTVKLSDLLNEAVDRARNLLQSKNTDLNDTEIQEIAEAVGIGAVKYADLSKTRTNDYVFDWDSMLSFDGNTAPYLQYAYTRIRSILRRAEVDETELAGYEFAIQHPEERSLALAITGFADVVEQVGDRAMPHELCNYLFDLSGRFMGFYESCPILKSDVSPEDRQSRLRLASLTSRVLRQGLDLLGIQTLERM